MRNGYHGLAGGGLFLVLSLCVTAVQAGWELHETANRCVLNTEELTLHDGYQDTTVRLDIDNDRLLVITASNIDDSFDDTGLQVDGRDVILSDAVEDEQSLRFDKRMVTVLDQFRKGNRVRVYLRFWPTYPATQRYEAGFTLVGFTRAFNDYTACMKRISQ